MVDTFYSDVERLKDAIRSKGMHTYETGAVREEKTGKGRMDLLPMCALIRLSKHFEKGSKDHGERNWENGLPMHSFMDSALRHIVKYIDGQTDEDHLCAAAWNLLCAMWTEEKKPEMQDIPTRFKLVQCSNGCVIKEPIAYPYSEPSEEPLEGSSLASIFADATTPEQDTRSPREGTEERRKKYAEGCFG